MDGHALGHFGLPQAIRRILIASALLCAAFLSADAQATTYRWVDEHGGVHYGDSIPSRYAGAGHEELDSQGRVRKRVESAPATEQERQQREAAAARQEAVKRSNLEQQHYDNALVSTYDSPAEIDEARDRQLAQEKAAIDSLMVQLKQAGNPAEIERIDNAVMLRYRNIQDIYARFKADKERYEQLTGKR